MDGEILGSGCANCAVLERRTREALADLNLTTEISKVTDYGDIAATVCCAPPRSSSTNRFCSPGRVPDRAAVAGLLARWPQRHDDLQTRRASGPPTRDDRTAHVLERLSTLAGLIS